MKTHIFTLILSSAIFVTNPTFAVLQSSDDDSSCTTPHQTKGGLYLGDPVELNNKTFFQYQGTETSDKIRKIVDTTSSSQLKSNYPEHFSFYENNELSKHECHKYALAKLFDYKTMPEWIFYTLIPSMFDCNKYLKPTSTPKKGDLVVYYASSALVMPTHFGIFDGIDSVISTWGKSTDDADRHAPFFTPEMYGKYIAFYTSPEDTDFKSIRNAIEKQNLDDVYNKALGSLEFHEKENIKMTSNFFITEIMQPSNIERILNTIKRVEQNDREACKNHTISLIDGKVNIIDNVISIFEEISKISPDKRAQVISDAKIISFNRMTVFDFARLKASSQESFYMNGLEISLILKEVNKLPEQGRPEILKDVNLIATKLKDRDISDVIKFTAGLSSVERTALINSTMALIKGKVLWSQVKEIMSALKKLPSEKWPNIAEVLKDSYDGGINASFFLFQQKNFFGE